MIYTLRDELHGAYLRALRNHDAYEVEYINISGLFCHALLENRFMPSFTHPLDDYRSKWPHMDDQPLGTEGHAYDGKYYVDMCMIYFFPQHCEVYSKLHGTTVMWRLDLATFEWFIV